MRLSLLPLLVGNDEYGARGGMMLETGIEKIVGVGGIGISNVLKLLISETIPFECVVQR